MTLPKGFIFSQSSLQDYVDCQRRFQLRHILHQAWPAVEAEPYLENEHLIELGSKFHKIVHQHLIGVPEAQIAQSISGDDALLTCWNSYLQAITEGTLDIFDDPGNQRFEEIILSVSTKGFRLIAKFDLLLIRPNGKWSIFDWKTSQKHPKHRWLADRLQTHVYPFVVSGAGSSLTGGISPTPGQIEMVYWYALQPQLPEHFPYSQTKYKEDGRYLENLIASIDRKTENIFPLTPDVRHCLYCTYRSLCNRGVKAGDLSHLDELPEPESPEAISIDYDQIGEIDF